MKLSFSKISLFFFTFLVFTLFFSGFVSAQSFGYSDSKSSGASPGTYRQGQNISLIQTCADCTFVNITSITAPNGTQLVGNNPMTQTGSVFNFTLNNSLTQALGTYRVNGIGNPLGVNEVWVYSIEVTPSGIVQSSIFENPVLIILSLLSLIFLGLAVYFKLPSLGFIGGSLMVVLGVYVMIYGFNNYTDLYTRSVAGAILGLGFIFIFVSAYEWYFGGSEEEE